MSKCQNEHVGKGKEGEIYDALVARGGRMGAPLTLGDLDRGLLGEEGRMHAVKFREALVKARIPYDSDTTIG